MKEVFPPSLIPPDAANIILHLAAINSGLRSDIGLAVIIFPPIA